MAPYRKEAADIETRQLDKKHRIQETLSQLEAWITTLDEKATDLQVELDKWKALLNLLIGPDRKEKRPDINWDAHFIELMGNEIEPIPAPLVGDDLTFQDVVLKVSVHINTLETHAQKYKSSCDKKKEMLDKQLKFLDKKEWNLKRKAEALLENPAVLDEKLMETRSLGR